MHISKYLKTKVLRNGLWLYALQFFNTIIPLLTIPYITRVISTTQYGIFSTALNIIGYLQVVIEYGFGMSATRKIACNENNNEEVNRLFSIVFISRLLLFLISIVIIILVSIFSNMDLNHFYCLILLSLCLVGYCFQQNWLFQGMQEMKYISIINIITRLLSTIFIFIFIKSEKDLFLYSFLYSISPLIGGLSGFLIAKRKYSLKLKLIGKNNIIKELKDGWPIFTTQLSSKVFGAIGITFLSVFANSSNVGVFSAIHKIPMMIILIWSPISQVVYPIVSNKMAQSFKEGYSFVIKLRNILLPFFIFICLLLSVLSEDVVYLIFGEQYSSSFYLLPPLLLWVILSINNNFYGIQILLTSGNDKLYEKCFHIGVIFTIALNLILIMFFDNLGAAIAPVISELLLLIMLHIKVKKLKNNY